MAKAPAKKKAPKAKLSKGFKKLCEITAWQR